MGLCGLFQAELSFTPEIPDQFPESIPNKPGLPSLFRSALYTVATDRAVVYLLLRQIVNSKDLEGSCCGLL
jgi:hypothetical protein